MNLALLEPIQNTPGNPGATPADPSGGYNVCTQGFGYNICDPSAKPPDEFSLGGMIHNAAGDLLSTPGAQITTQPDPNNPGTWQPTDLTGFISAHALFITWTVFAAAVCVQGAVIAWPSFTGKTSYQQVYRLGEIVARFVMTIGMGAAIVQLLSSFGDTLTPWLLNDATSGSTWEDRMNALVAKLPSPGWSAEGIAVAVLGALIGLGIFLFTLTLMFIAGMLPIMVGLWPLTVSVHMLMDCGGKLGGGSPLSKYIFAMATYKIYVGFIFAGVFYGMGTTATDGSVWPAIVALLAALLLTPKLVKMFSPLDAAPGTGGSVAGAGVMTAGLVVAAAR